MQSECIMNSGESRLDTLRWSWSEKQSNLHLALTSFVDVIIFHSARYSVGNERMSFLFSM